MRKVFRIPFAGAHIARDVDDELAFHLETRTKRLIAAGWAPDAARQEALRQFGDVESVREHCVIMDQQRERAMRRADVVGELRQDIMYALRTLRRNIAFTIVVVCTLALGIGANTAIFTLIDAVLVRPLPVKHPEQLVAIGNPTRVSSMSNGSPATDLISYPLYRDLRDQNHVFDGVLASGRAGRLDTRIETGAGEPEHPHARFVSGNYFSVLGIPAAAGRTFDASADGVPGGSPVATISHAYWTQRFHNDASVIGRTISINNVKVTIVGVAAAAFNGEIVGAATDIWLPLSMQDALRPNQRLLDDRSTCWLLLLGRLAPGVTLAQAEQQLGPLITRNIVAHATPKGAKAFLESKPTIYVASGARGFSRVRDTFRAPLVTLMIGVALLLCIICANVANLLLARSIARGREMAVRLALGADRSRLVRQLLTESAVLAGLSTGIGLVVAWWGGRALLVLASDGTPLPINIGMNLVVLAFTLAVSVLAVGLFGLAPALRASRVDLASTMRASAHTVGGGALGGRGQRASLGRLLIAGQVAMSIVLLLGAAMLVRSLRNVQSADVGLDRDHLVILEVDLRSRDYRLARLANLAHSVRDALAAVPGVVAVGYSENGIFSGTESHTTIGVPGFVATSMKDTVIASDLAGPDYVRAIGGHLLAGRDIAASDEGKAPRVAIVNQTLANFYFPKQNAVGKFIHLNDSIAVEIVGVIADTRDHRLDAAPERRMYFPYAHTDTSGALDPPGSLRFEIRTTGDPATYVRQLHRAVLAVEPSLPITGIDPLPTLMQESIRQQWLVARLATGLGALALLLASVGLYGVMTYAITRRTSEIGLRAALGAQRGDVMRMVLFDALRLVGMGVAVGMPVALWSTRLLKTQLHGVESADPVSIGVAVSVLVVSAVVAVLIPAVRASRVSPIVALRAE